MPLRSGKEYRKKEYLKVLFPKETQPFNMVLLPERVYNTRLALISMNQVKHGEKIKLN